MAAGSTYTPIATTTLGSAVSSYTFSSISGSYTDLVLVLTGYATGADNSLCLQVGNGSVDTGANYSTTALSGSGSAASSGRYSNETFMRLQRIAGMSTSSSNPTNTIVHLMNYSNTSTYKTIINRANQAAGSYPGVEAIVNLWRSTSAINVITIYPYTGASFAAGTQITLYGIQAA